MRKPDPAGRDAAVPPGGEAAPSRSRGGRKAPGWGATASLVLHGAVLACVAGWHGGRAESPPAMDVAVVLQTAPAPAPVAEPVAPPSPPARHRPTPPRHRAGAAPGHAVSAKPAPMAAAPPGVADAASSTGTTGEGMATASDSPAVPLADNPAPAYPMPARRAGREGRTVLLVVVAATGECADVEIAETSGTPSLDEAAAAAIRRWRFIPARRSGRATETAIRVPVTFRLIAGL